MATSPTSTGSTAGNIPSAGSAPATGAVLPTVANFQQTAGQNISNAGATALAQVAAAGSRGQAAFQQAQAQNAAAKTAALQAIMGQQALRGAPIGNIQANEQTGVAPLVSRAQDLSSQAANYEANNQGLQAANANYFAGLQGALPIDNAAIQSTISNDQAKAAIAASAANAKAAADAKAAAGADSLSSLTSNLGGAQLGGQLLNQRATAIENALAQQQGYTLGSTYGQAPYKAGSPAVPGAPATPATGGSSGGLPGGMPNLAGGGGAPVVLPGTQAAPGTPSIPAVLGGPMSPAQQAQNQAAAYGAIDQGLGANVPSGYSQNLATQAEQATAQKAVTDQKAAISLKTAQFNAQNLGVLSNTKFVNTVVTSPSYQPNLNAAMAFASGPSAPDEGQIQQYLIAHGVPANAAVVVAVNAYKLVNNTASP